MGLKDFVAREPRPLPIFILADTSGSMSGDKINILNLALRDMIISLDNTEEIRGKFEICIIAFGQDTKVIQPLTDVNGLVLPELFASGSTPMGMAFDLAHQLIEDKDIVSSRSYAPTVVLISDGLPTDCPQDINKTKNFQDWDKLAILQNGERSSRCQRLALGIGEDADITMLKAFINNDEIPVIKAGNAFGISKFFKWVTMSTIARMNSINPNQVATVAPIFDISSEDIII